MYVCVVGVVLSLGYDPHLITSLTMALAISLGGRDVDQAGISYCLHLAFPSLP